MDLSAEQNRASDPCPQSHHDNWTGLNSCAEMKFPDGRGIGIVLQKDRDGERLSQRADNVRILPAGEGVGVVNSATRRAHRPGTTNANAIKRFARPTRFL